jgi:hypothetical protein
MFIVFFGWGGGDVKGNVDHEFAPPNTAVSFDFYCDI